MARHWQAEGAQRLHVVDLDGARDGIRANAEAITRVLQSVSIPVQVGGGIRSSVTVQTLLDDGAARVVIGTTAAEHPEELGEWVTAFGSDSIIVAVDAHGGRVATHGWQNVTDLDVLGFCRLLKQHGVERVLYTDVARDGRLLGPDIEGTRAIAGLLKVIGSGGVATVAHLRELADVGAEGAIIGTALYEGRLKLGDALVTAC
jgi:phosphoribosylformimino-5-aminoimidazole carboxamide ribotide isomerase